MFWTSKQRQDMEQFVRGIVESISEQINEVEERVSQQSDLVIEQLNKLGRLQVKTAHDVSDKLQRVLSSIEEFRRGHVEVQQSRARIARLEQQLEQMVMENIRFIDDLDVLVEKMEGTPQTGWDDMFHHWTKRMLQHLSDVGVREIHVMGMSFDPHWCESIGAVDADENKLTVRQPYEVIRVVRRGFVKADGNVLRKAQVITVKGVNSHRE